MVLQVFIFMPLRTIMNYQYRFGKPFWVAATTLFAEGGYGRYYQGISAAIIQAPVSRFGDTASNTFIFAVLKSSPTLDALPSPIKSFLAAIFTAMFRIILTPIDTAKTTLQVQGGNGWKVLKVRVRMYGIGSLWYGAVATAAATVVGYFPWFGVYNLLDVNLPRHHNFHQLLIRQTAIGSCASLASDTVSNSLRVVKTYRQVNETQVSYSEAAKAVIAIDGLRGLFFRGLGTRLLANGCQSITFSILWKLFMDLWNKNSQRPLVEL
ncbi:mitochondrial carrier [Cantharellus anzutake]|uniref:mitochondrial carrier n=1 Tax=Cantharellus anzutake TaxID=1750568 RepID=UPI001906B065|nr:mitochondrial carrier [Cantharellus anzutake]KAF8315552.1 mitochondrial carrier [Cantharellus anzutake]